MVKGSKHSPEALKKISESTKNGKRLSNYVPTKEHKESLSKANKGQTPWMKGKTQSQEHVKKRLDSRVKNGTTSKVTAPRGGNHYLYMKDRTKLVKSEKKHLDGRYREWMRAVKDRDDWKCRIADKHCKKRLEAHHILRWSEFPELRYKLNNGITLCQFHHPRKRDEERRLISTFRRLIGSN